MAALEIIESVLRRDPNNFDALGQQATYLMALGRAAEAEAALRRLVELLPRASHHWLRLAGVVFPTLIIVGLMVILLQFLWVLFTGRTKKEFSAVGRQLAEYSKEIVLYLSFNTDERPFPFDRDWPSSS